MAGSAVLSGRDSPSGEATPIWKSPKTAGEVPAVSVVRLWVPMRWTEVLCLIVEVPVAVFSVEWVVERDVVVEIALEQNFLRK